MSNANPSANAATLAGHPQNTRDAASEFDEILALAREAGMLITLDGQIGREKYQSIAGSLHAFKRFAEAFCESLSQRATA
ncbi:hypothetical protein PQR37_03610 [Paraburkholderia nemoris]|jgi:hypothetical protein|uniref:hypothetical protein n=1 Tax=Paraburkholderia TaxID=1822464 RepID=UPI0006B53BD7|nr:MULTISPECIES: hypothetical protein [Paraburkholderia]KPD17507.1 hypothetical protein ADM96_18120 [Burkholderia sp. ST111]MBK5146087.1 hypothetical protein [Burkholderia sp. R-69608]MBK3739010.1 hypothetical protein [Paraburkholderia aspalathi]MBK3781613.1 hypothetical protein [Paraburkholderia aspalathi]MCX4157643.1 hypothetical protein [Paraburkholderia aspalathi]